MEGQNQRFNLTKRNILRCSKLNDSGLEGEQERQGIQSVLTRGQLSRLLTFLSVCWNPELTSRWLFPLLSKTAQQPLLLIYTELSKMLPTTNPKEQTPLPQGLCGAYPRISPSRPFPIPSPRANVHSFKTAYILLPTTGCIKRCWITNTGLRRLCISPWHCRWWFQLHAPGPGLFLASNDPISSFFQKTFGSEN